VPIPALDSKRDFQNLLAEINVPDLIKPKGYKVEPSYYNQIANGHWAAIEGWHLT
jgi:peptide/nickel transport system ATP-binding protein